MTDTEKRLQKIEAVYGSGIYIKADEILWLVAELRSAQDRVRELEADRKVFVALVERLDDVHKDERYEEVWVSYMIHGGKYVGPTYTKEFETALDAARSK